MFALVIDTGNAAFDGTAEQEVARLLRAVAFGLEQGYVKGPIHDINGQPVGRYVLKPDNPAP